MRRLLVTFHSSYSGMPRTAWLLALASAVNRSGSMVLPFLALYLTESRGYAPDETGRLQSLYGFAAILGSWLGGALSDRIGAKVVQIGSLLVTAVLFLVLSEMRSTIAIAGALLALGVSNEALRPANLTAMSLVATDSVRTRVLALNRLAVNFGVTFGWMIGGYLAEVDFKWLFIADAVTAVCAAVVVAFVDMPDRGRNESNRAVLTPMAPLRDRVFVRSLALVFVLACALFQMDSTLPIYLTNEYSLEKPHIATLFVINTIMIVFLEMVVVKRLESKPALPLVGLGTLFLCTGLGILPFGSSYAFVAFAMVVLTIGEMLWSPFMTSFVASRSGPESRGQYMGLYLQMFAIAYAVAPAIGTALYVHVSPDAPWWVILAIGPLAALGFRRLDRADDDAAGTRAATLKA